jgi:hypothetical protein
VGLQGFGSVQVAQWDQPVRSLFVWEEEALDCWLQPYWDVFQRARRARYSLAGLIDLSIFVRLELRLEHKLHRRTN